MVKVIAMIINDFHDDGDESDCGDDPTDEDNHINR